MKLHQTGITLKGSYTNNFRYVQLQVPGKYIPYVYAFTFDEIDTRINILLGSEIILGTCHGNKIYYLEYFRIGHDLPK